MQIKVMSVNVDDQERALAFYTGILGFTKHADFTNGPYRWLTVTSPDQQDGVELQLAPATSPAAQTYQQALFEQGQPALMLYTDDVQQEYDRMQAAGARFTMPPTKVTGSTIAMVDDTCGNLVQLVALDRWS